MIIGTSRGTYASYRCPPTGDCGNRMAIGSDIVERMVTERVRAALADVSGHASAQSNVHEAEQALEHAQNALDETLRAFEGFEDEPVARQRLVELCEARDTAQARLEQLGGETPGDHN